MSIKIEPLKGIGTVFEKTAQFIDILTITQ